MNTKYLANRFDTDGNYSPMDFSAEEPNFALEFLAGLAGLIGLVSLIFLVAVL